MNDLRYTNQVPDAEEFIELRVRAGLSQNKLVAATTGLAGTWFCVCVRDGEDLIGMGRVIGDGGCFFQIVDIAIHPDYQRREIDFQIMSQLMVQLRQNAPQSAYVSLIADGDASELYRKFGFEMTAPASVGMALRL